jgi:hypothetical protein
MFVEMWTARPAGGTASVMRKSRVSVSASGLLALLIGTSALAQDKSPNRYPFDPSCPWGRLANGKGMVVRCLTESEAIGLSSARTNTQPVPTPTTNAAAVETPAPPKKTADVLDADVVSVTADEGSLAIARKKLRIPREQYARCVSDNGGLLADTGEVTVRFLVRERGRAEGASVEKRVGVGEAAARCIAAVVDRRPVGTPEGPVVGATVVIRVSKSAKR